MLTFVLKQDFCSSWMNVLDINFNERYQLFVIRNVPIYDYIVCYLIFVSEFAFCIWEHWQKSKRPDIATQLNHSQQRPDTAEK